jgi:hypothetical protein
LLTAGAALASQTALPPPPEPPFVAPPFVDPPFGPPPAVDEPPLAFPPVELEPPLVEPEPEAPADEFPVPPALVLDVPAVPAAPPGLSELFEQATLATAPAASKTRSGVARRSRRVCDM